MGTENFYAELPVLDHFPGICRLENYALLPDDWLIVVADVQNSTGAIRDGQYKAVNVLGVSVITAVLNEAKPLAIPYIFGGDGASLCIPADLKRSVRQALSATQSMAMESFGLVLRAGIVPLSVVRDAGHRVLVARHRVSKYMVQAAFTGGGIEYAETLLKDEKAGEPYRLAAQPESRADLTGLECRWDSVPSRHGETISLIVKALAPSIQAQSAIYDRVIARVRAIYGEDEICRPVYEQGLRLTNVPHKLRFEASVRTWAQGRLAYLRRIVQILVQNVIGRVFMSFRLNVGGVPWGDYKPDLVANTDFRKFDGVLRQVISGTAAQREELERWLEDLRGRGECVYGIHASRAAIFTCMISKRHGDHFHFVDGADGGYAMAAVQLKRQLRKLSGDS